MENIELYSCKNPMPRKKFSILYKIMEYSFPPTERGSEKLHYSEMSRPEFRCLCYEPDGNPSAFLNYYDFTEQSVVYVEHFAVAQELRGKGTGSALIQYLKKSSAPSIIVLEVELPEGDIQRRRIEFYQRLGFYLNQGDYFQPEFYGNPIQIPMKLMSTEPLDNESFEKVKNLIHQKAYQR